MGTSDNNAANRLPVAEKQEVDKKPGEKLGDFLVQHGLLTKDELAGFLKEQAGKRKKRLGDIIVETNGISRKSLEEAIKRATAKLKGSAKNRVGEILVAAGILESEELKEALVALYHEKHEKLGTLLIGKGVINEDQLLAALALKHKLEFVDLEKNVPAKEAVTLIKKPFATKYNVMPVAVRGKTLQVAVNDPTDPFLEEYLSFSAGRKIELVLATGEQIQRAHEIFYNEDKNQLHDLINDMSEVVAVDDEEVDVDQFKESDSAVIKFVNKVLLAAVQERASDIHFEPGLDKGDLKIRFRVDGECHVAFNVPPSFKKAVISRLKILANLDIAERRKPQSGKIRLKSGNERLEFRVEITPTSGGQEDAVLRVMANIRAIPLEKLGFSKECFKDFKGLIQKPYGIILCVGPTGSGKTTTLHSALSQLNVPNRKIWTAEDPVEINQEGLRQVQVNHRIGFTFSEALRSFLRADPDVIMVGEMRDPETAKISIEASLTGHLVFSTLHTNTAVETVNRLLQVGIDPLLFADALLGIIGQRLVLKLCESCKESFHPEQDHYEQLIQSYGPEFVKADKLPIFSKKLALMRKKGCAKCNNTGYQGRVGIYELLQGTDRIKQAIIERKPVAEIRSIALEDGMRTMKMDGIQKVIQGITDYEQIIKVCQ